MWGGLQDAANLWPSYNIKVECMLDLQGNVFYPKTRLYYFLPQK